MIKWPIRIFILILLFVCGFLFASQGARDTLLPKKAERYFTTAFYKAAFNDLVGRGKKAAGKAADKASEAGKKAKEAGDKAKKAAEKAAEPMEDVSKEDKKKLEKVLEKHLE